MFHIYVTKTQFRTCSNTSQSRIWQTHFYLIFFVIEFSIVLLDQKNTTKTFGFQVLLDNLLHVSNSLELSPYAKSVFQVQNSIFVYMYSKTGQQANERTHK